MTLPRAGQPDDADYRTEIDRLRQLAMRDELTGLANRRAFLERLGNEIARSRRHGVTFSLILLDLDGLKDLNDTFGHQAGDAALRTFGQALAAAVRAEDLVARIGGDEFAVLGVHGAQDSAGAFARRISEIASGLNTRLEGHTQAVRLSASWGMATWSPDIPNAETLFAQAETALIAHKRTPTGAPTLELNLFLPRGRRTLGEELRILLGMARRVSSARELQELGRTAAEQAAALVGARMATVVLKGSDGRTGYRERWVAGAWREDQWWYAEGEGLIGRVMQTAQPYVANDVQSDPLADQTAVTRQGVNNTMLLPLRNASGQAMGVLSLTDKRDTRGFGEPDIELGMAFADLVAVAIENMRSREEAETAHAYALSLMEQANDAIYIVDPPTRRILDANQAAEVLSGYTRAELLSMVAPELRPPELRDQPGTTDLARDAKRLVTPPRGHLRKDGAVIPVEVSLSRVHTPRGDVIVNIVRDVRQRVAAEEALRRHNRELQARNDIAALLATSAGEPDVMVQMLAIVCRTLALEGAVLGQFDPHTATMSVDAEYQVPDPLRGHLLSRRYRPHEGKLGVALAGQPVVVNETGDRAAQTLDVIRQAGVRSFAALPMVARGTTMGVLAAGSNQPNRFTEAVIDFLRAVANQAALWLEHHRLLNETRRREQDARLLADLGEMLNRTSGIDRIAQRLAQRLTDALGRTVAIFLREPESEVWGVARVSYARGAPRKSVAAKIRRYAALPPGFDWPTNRPTTPVLLTVEDPALDPRIAARMAELGNHALLLAPLMLGTRDYGVIAIGAARSDTPITTRELGLVGDIARHATVAVANAFARRAVLARNRELQLMNNIAVLVQTASDSAELYEQVVQRLRKALRVRSVVLRLWDDEAAILRFAAAAGVASPSTEWLNSAHLPLDGSAMGEVARSRRILVIDDWLSDPRVPFKSPHLKGQMAAVIVPLQAGDSLIGVLTVLGLPGRRFDPPETQLIGAVAGQLAAGLARFAAYEQAEAGNIDAHAPHAGKKPGVSEHAARQNARGQSFA